MSSKPRMLESFIEYLISEPDTSPLAFFIILGSLCGLLYLGYKFVIGIILSHKLYLYISLVPAIIIFVMSVFMASYGSGLKLFNPGVYLVAVLTFLLTFCVLIGFEYGSTYLGTWVKVAK